MSCCCFLTVFAGYHCSCAHADLASNIDETNYSTELLTPHLSIQQAPPRQRSPPPTRSLPPPQDEDATTATATASASDYDQRFGNQTAVYAQWYPNLMLNRYGPWLDLDLVIPMTATTTQILKVWFLERDFELPCHDYIATSLASSERVHGEDVFLCENVQLGLQSHGFDTGRYVPTKQIATYHFHQQLARDLRQYYDSNQLPSS